MRRFALFSLLFLAACTVESRNGEVVRTTPPLISGSRWEITRQAMMPDGGKICTVSAGELDVSMHGHDGNIVPEIGTSYSLNPGDRYRLTAGSHTYETTEARFKPRDATAILHDLLTHDIVYTEIQERVVRDASEWKRFTNKIRMAGFAEAWKGCERFVRNTPSPGRGEG